MKRMIAFSVLSMVLVCAAVGQMSDKKTKAKTSGNGNIEQTLMQMVDRCGLEEGHGSARPNLGR